MSDIIVRPLRPEDAPAASRVHYESWVDTYVRPDLGVTREWIDERWASRISPEGVARYAELIARNDTSMGQRRLGAEADGELVGCALPFVEPGRGQRVGAIYVLTPYLGRGVGTALMREVIAGFDATQPIFLQVASYNARAIAFYERFGFAKIPGSDTVYDGVIPEFWMRREPDRAPERP